MRTHALAHTPFLPTQPQRKPKIPINCLTLNEPWARLTVGHVYTSGPLCTWQNFSIPPTSIYFGLEIPEPSLSANVLSGDKDNHETVGPWLPTCTCVCSQPQTHTHAWRAVGVECTALHAHAHTWLSAVFHFNIRTTILVRPKELN